MGYLIVRDTGSLTAGDRVEVVSHDTTRVLVVKDDRAGGVLEEWIPVDAVRDFGAWADALADTFEQAWVPRPVDDIGDVTLVRRDSLKQGEWAYSSHYGWSKVDRIDAHLPVPLPAGHHVGIRWTSQDHRGDHHTERYEGASLIPCGRAAAPTQSASLAGTPPEPAAARGEGVEPVRVFVWREASGHLLLVTSDRALIDAQPGDTVTEQRALIGTPAPV